MRDRTLRELFRWSDGHGFQPIRRKQSRPAPPTPLTGPRTGRWTEKEHELFLDGLALYPHGPWQAIALHIGTRNERQVLTHAQKYRRLLRNLETDEDAGTVMIGVGGGLTVAISPEVNSISNAAVTPEGVAAWGDDGPIEDATELANLDLDELVDEVLRFLRECAQDGSA